MFVGAWQPLWERDNPEKVKRGTFPSGRGWVATHDSPTTIASQYAHHNSAKKNLFWIQDASPLGNIGFVESEVSFHSQETSLSFGTKKRSLQ